MDTFIHNEVEVQLRDETPVPTILNQKDEDESLPYQSSKRIIIGPAKPPIQCLWRDIGHAEPQIIPKEFISASNATLKCSGCLFKDTDSIEAI
jgi:hypothetical protein